MQVKLGCETEKMDYLGSRLGDLFFGPANVVVCLGIESCGLHLKGLSGTFVLGRDYE